MFILFSYKRAVARVGCTEYSDYSNTSYEDPSIVSFPTSNSNLLIQHIHIILNSYQQEHLYRY